MTTDNLKKSLKGLNTYDLKQIKHYIDKELTERIKKDTNKHNTTFQFKDW